MSRKTMSGKIARPLLFTAVVSACLLLSGCSSNLGVGMRRRRAHRRPRLHQRRRRFQPLVLTAREALPG